MRLSMTNLTTRQLEILLEIIRCHHLGLPCTNRHLGRATGITGPNGIVMHLERLERKGMITRNRDFPTLSGRAPCGAIRSNYRLEIYPEAFRDRDAAEITEQRMETAGFQADEGHQRPSDEERAT
jgi:SOS-response transcriptional repressor LexA